MSLQSSGLPAGLKHSDLSGNGPHIEPEFLTEDEARRRREQLNRRPSYRMILKDLETVGDNKTLKKEIDEGGMDRGNMQPPGAMNNLTSLYVPPSSNGTMHGGNPNASPANDMEPNSVGSSGNSVFSPRTLTELPQQMPVSSEPQRLSQNSNVMGHVNPNDLLSIKPVNDAVARATTAAAANFMNNAVLENQNKALIEELKTLKELYCRKEKAELS
uniref:KID domain-containing protein n=1 Tax=Panagrolaimus sp. ES5 TaxID=591445 RepID=A0AC34FSW6_9BILA